YISNRCFRQPHGVAARCEFQYGSTSVAPSNRFATGIGVDGVIGYAQPAFTNLSGAATTGQLPGATLRRTCQILIGVDNGSALTTAQIQPQRSRCKFDVAATVFQVDMLVDAG